MTFFRRNRRLLPAGSYGRAAGKRHAGRLRLSAAAALLIGVFMPAWSAARTIQLVALGDSLTAGYSLPASAAFPVVLEAALKAKGYEVAITNAGVSGETTTDGLARVDWSVPDGTDALILELGANDMLRGIDPAIAERALAEIITRLQKRNIKVLLAGMLAVPDYGPAYKQKFDAIYPALSKQFGIPLYPFFLEGIAGDPKFYLPDGLHPNPAGVKVIAQHILPSVERWLQQVPR